MDALRKILARATPLARIEATPLHQAAGRILARAVKAKLTMPPCNRSERDGYAVRASDCTRPGALLTQIGVAVAGSPFRAKVGAGQCVRIATGAVMPPGTDAVVMFEDADDRDGSILARHAVERFSWVARTGSDMRRGRPLAARGDSITPAQISVIAANGHREVKVFARPRVLLFTTGDEVKRHGERLSPGDVYDGNTAALAALLSRHGAEVTLRDNVQDSLAALRRTLKSASTRFDLVVFSGGTSVGDRDFGRRALDAEGRTEIHGISLKPGKPLLFGSVGRCLVFGLPGFPTSCLLVAYVMVIPALRSMARAGTDAQRITRHILAEPLQPDLERLYVAPVALDAKNMAHPVFKGSASLTSVSDAAGYVILEAGLAAVEAGSEVAVHRW